MKTILSIFLLASQACLSQTNFWSPATGPAAVTSLFEYSNEVTLAGTGVAVFRSTDNGNTWLQSSGLPVSGYQGFLTFTKTPNGDAYAGTGRGYVYRSTDSGSSWNAANPGWIAVSVNALLSNYSGHVFATNFGINKTTNSGVTWTVSLLPNSAYGTSLAIAIDSTVFVGSYNYGVFKSVNNGSTWIACGGNFAGLLIKDLQFDSRGNLFAASNTTSIGKIYFSSDRGATWELRSLGLPNALISSVRVNSNDHLFAATDNSGVFRSKNHGRTWDPINSGLTSLLTTSVALAPDGFIQTGTDGGVFRSQQSTTLFSLERDSVVFDTVRVGQSERDSVFIVNRGTEPLVIDSVHSNKTDFHVTPAYASVSVGEGKWFYISFIPTTYGRIVGTISFASNANSSPDEVTVSGTGKAAFLYKGTNDLLFGRTRIGTTKDTTIELRNTGNDLLTITSIVSSDSHFEVQPTTIVILPGQVLQDTIRFSPTSLGETTARIVLASNSLSSPDTLMTKGIGFGVSGINIPDSVIFAGTVHMGMHKDTIVTVSNFGNDTLHFFGIESSRSTFFVRASGTSIPPGGSRSDTLRFAPMSPGSDSATIVYRTNAPTSPDTLHVFGLGDTVTTGVGENTSRMTGLPAQYKLYGNYPNPFNPSTQIKFDLPEDGIVNLNVFDVLGRKVGVLANGRYVAGYHSVIWNASDVASGVYFARFTATDGSGNVKLSKVNKLLLAK